MKSFTLKPLVLQNLTKRYGQFRGVDDVSLGLEPGEVFGFLGPNGAGKSTTIRTILNFIKPSQGSISVFGLDSVKDSVQIKNHIGYLAGDIALYETMTGQQIIDFLSSLGKSTDYKFVKQLANDLEATLDKPIKSLSKGNKQKIGLIQAFMHKPDLLILDEPTSGLDPLMKQVFYDMIKTMQKQGKTVFVSSHDLTEVQKICDRAAFIRGGKLVAIEDIRGAKRLNLRRYSVTFNEKPKKSDFTKVKNVTKVEAQENELLITVRGSVAPLLSALAVHHPIDLTEQETTLEDLFMHFYKGGQDE